jgi:UDP-N-acetylmuramoyl-tripeptide--D-alanyl-D-alanine ligase
MELHERPDGLLVVNDTYNANPASMAAAIDALVAIGGRRSRRTVAVLGEMRELGDTAAASHREVGAHAATAGVDVVLAVGEPAAGIAEGARLTAGWHGEAMLTAGRAEALDWLRKNAGPEDVVLVKASRGAALEAVADGLLETQPETEGGTSTP